MNENKKADAPEMESSSFSQKLNRFFDRLLRRWIADDITVMVFSIISAVLIWFVVAYTEDETISTVIRDVPVNFNTTTSTLARLDLTPIMDSEMTVDVEVSGSRATVGNLAASDIRAEAKLNNVTGPGTYEIALDVTDYVGKEFEVKGVIPETLTVRFDRYIDKLFKIDLDLIGLEIPDGYILDAEYLYPGDVMVTGPETEISSIASVKAMLEFDEPVSKTAVYDVELGMYDADGNKIKPLYVEMDIDTATVTLPILKKKTVPITFDFVNVPEGFDVDTLKYEILPSEMEIAGPEQVYSTVNEIHLGYIDLTDFTPEEPFVYTIELPTGFISVDNTQEATIAFEAENYTTTTLNVGQIKLINTPHEYDVIVSTKMIYGVEICGPGEDIEKLTSSDLVAEINMRNVDIRVGQSTVDVSILIPDYPACWAYGDTYTAVITAKQATPD